MKSPEHPDATYPLFNPLPHDFSCEWLDDNNSPHTLTIPSKQIKDFPKARFEFVKKHLADAVVNSRGGTNTEELYKKAYEEIEVKL